MILRCPGERDLPHQLAAQAELVVGVGQVGEGLQRRVAGAANDRVDVADPLKQGADRGRIDERDLHLAVARGADNFMPLFRERLRDLAADGAGRSDDEDFHGLAFPAAPPSPRRGSMEVKSGTARRF